LLLLLFPRRTYCLRADTAIPRLAEWRVLRLRLLWWWWWWWWLLLVDPLWLRLLLRMGRMLWRWHLLWLRRTRWLLLRREVLLRRCRMSGHALWTRRSSKVPGAVVLQRHTLRVAHCHRLLMLHALWLRWWSWCGKSGGGGDPADALPVALSVGSEFERRRRRWRPDGADIGHRVEIRHLAQPEVVGVQHVGHRQIGQLVHSELLPLERGQC